MAFDKLTAFYASASLSCFILAYALYPSPQPRETAEKAIEPTHSITAIPSSTSTPKQRVPRTETPVINNSPQVDNDPPKRQVPTKHRMDAQQEQPLPVTQPCMELVERMRGAGNIPPECFPALRVYLERLGNKPR